MSGMVLIAISRDRRRAADAAGRYPAAILRHRRAIPPRSDALLWIRSPEVHILIIPCFAFMSEIIPAPRKPIFGYPVMAAATVCIAFVSM